MKKIYANLFLEILSLPTEDVIRTSFDNEQDMEAFPEETPPAFVQ